MSNRYRIYYYLRGAWYTFLQKIKTAWRTFRGNGGGVPGTSGTNLNDIIFSDNNEMEEGLLMRQS